MTHAGALWRDEVNSVEFATMPSLSNLYESLRYDSFPMLSTLVMRAWVKVGLGHGDWGFRLLGLVTGVAFLGSLWVACRLLGCPSPLISLTLVGLSPWAVLTAASVRPYGLGMLLIVLTLAFLWRAIKSPTPRKFVAAGALAVLSVQCMYQNAFLLLAIAVAAGITALLNSRPRTVMAVGLVGVAAAASLVLYVPSISAARDWSVVVQTSSTTMAILKVLSGALGSGGVIRIWLWGALALLCATLGILALLERRKPASSKGKPNPAVFNAAVLILATLVYLTAVKATRFLTQPWYYVSLMALLAPVIESSAWAAARNTAWRIGRIALVLAIAGATVLPGWRQVTERRTNMDAIASYLETQAAAGDVIVVYPFYIGVSFQRYYRGAAAWMTLPPIEDLRIHRYDLLKAAEARSNPIDPILEAMTRSLRSGHRVWLVGGLEKTRVDRPAPAIPPAPHPKYGWYGGPYFYTWCHQAGYFLNTHALEREALPAIGRGPVSPYENIPVFVVSGWQ